MHINKVSKGKDIIGFQPVLLSHMFSCIILQGNTFNDQLLHEIEKRYIYQIKTKVKILYPKQNKTS